MTDRTIPGILGEIVEYKRAFVDESMRRISRRDIESMAWDVPPVRGFADALNKRRCALIAEIKTASPSRGIIRADVGVDELARLYTENGAACISVLTDEKYFKGSLDRLGMVRELVPLPLLRKDFMIDAYQIFEARAAGADAVLLIAACLDDAELREFSDMADHLGMDTLVEVHDGEEMRRISSLNTRMVGINNRDLRTFETTLETTGTLARLVPEHALTVSESGIFTAGDVSRVAGYGARAVLVGESIMRSDDIAGKVSELANAVG